MALHLNLYHEIHKQAERERRDPAKIAGLVALVIAILMTMWYFYRLAEVSKLQSQCRAASSRWGTVEPELKKLEANKENVLQRQKANRLLMERLQNRFYWAPVLQQIAETTGANIQLNLISGDLTEEKPADKTDPEKKDADKKKSVGLTVKGVAAGEQPRTAAEAYRKALQEKFAAVYGDATVVFDSNSLEDQAETVNLKGQTLPTASFRLRMKFSVAAPSATPTPSPQASR